jgi:hypothetical protein
MVLSRRSPHWKKFVLIAGFIVAVFISGAFYPSPCEESMRSQPSVQCDIEVPYRPGSRSQVSNAINAHFDESPMNSGMKA